ncbi:MAG: rhomboid family intramembrane serine protease [Nitrospirae bacterium]|nr:rhomboid family intramembrane serine protease [Nitrospirota bacterium]
MIPFKDDNPTTHFPFITISFILLNTIIFLFQFTYPGDSTTLAFSYGAIPAAILTMESVQPIHPAITVFTSMFMHGGLFHIAGNMLYLWIFGNNIEDKLGRMRFIIFYLLCGIIAAYSHAIIEPSSNVPMIGASGAVSGILGAYVLLFPKARVHTLIFLGFFIQVVRIPALIVIGFWAIIQFVNGIISTATIPQGGVAWFAHIGGFLIGILTIKLFLKTRRRYY